MSQQKKSFDEDIRFFLNACPGPAVLVHGLHLVAFQEVRGIPRLTPAKEDDGRRNVPERRGEDDREDRGDGNYLCTVTGVAELVKCRPAYLSEAALRHGYQYSRALRWIRFLHGMALYGEGVSGLTVAMRLGFSDLAGWSRFTLRLVGRTPSQLPGLPLEHWVRRAVDDLFFSPRETGAEGPEGNRGEDNLEP